MSVRSLLSNSFGSNGPNGAGIGLSIVQSACCARPRIWPVVLLLLGVFVQPAFAQENERKLLNLVVRMQGASVRTHGPILLDCTLEYAKSQLLEGNLRLRVREMEHFVIDVWVNDLVLPNGDYSFRTMIPAISGLQYNGLDLYPTFFTKDGDKIEMPEVSLIIPSQQERGAMVAFCSDSVSVKDDTIRAMERVLNLNQFNPFRTVGGKQTRSRQSKNLTVYPGRIAPGDLPETPIRFCGYDILTIVNDAYGRLKSPQLDVIDTWVQAGGNLCIIPGGSMEAEHAEFLNELIRATDKPPFLRDERGSLADREYPSGGAELIQHGLGRIAIIDPRYDFAAEVKSTSDSMTKVARYLWHVRKDRSFTEGKWEAIEEDENGFDLNYQQADYKSENDLSLHRNFGVGSILRRVMPEDVQLVPFGIVGGILFLYVLAIGPGDYMFLGMLKKRKLTWVLFPVVTLAFTMFTVWLSNFYMSATAPGRDLVIADIVDGGKVARQSHVGVTFTGSRQVIEKEFRDEIYMGLDHHAFSMGAAAMGRGRGSESGQFAPPTYSGRFPGNYRIRKAVAQWSPQMYRTFSIAPDRKVPPLEWDYPAGDGRTNAGKAALRQAIEAISLAEGEKLIAAFVAYQDRIEPVLGNTAEIFPFSSSQHRYLNGQYQYVEANALKELMFRRSTGLFHVVAQVAPSGAANFEDVALLDSSDSNQWALVLVLQTETEIQMFRRFYSGMPKKPLEEATNDEPADDPVSNDETTDANNE